MVKDLGFHSYMECKKAGFSHLIHRRGNRVQTRFRPVEERIGEHAPGGGILGHISRGQRRILASPGDDRSGKAARVSGKPWLTGCGARKGAFYEHKGAQLG